MSEIQGHCADAFHKVRAILREAIHSHTELGVSFALHIKGDTQIDLWGGFQDEQMTRPWEKDTVVPVWSTTKTVVTLAILMLVDRGLVDLDENVCHYWPEFAGGGKASIKVCHIMGHTSGVSGFEESVTWEDVYDFDKISSLLAEQRAWWTPPGERSGYHTMSWGYILDQIVRRVTGKTLSRFIQDEVSKPLNADFWLGLPQEQWGRVAEIVPSRKLPDGVTPKPGSISARTMTNPKPNPEIANGSGWRNAELAAANGVTNARALVRILSEIPAAVAQGAGEDAGSEGVGGSSGLLSRASAALVLEEQSIGEDLVLLKPLRFGVGFAMGADGDVADDEWLPAGPRVCYWGGWGGSVVVLDLDRQLTLAFVMNKMGDVAMANQTARACISAVYDALM